MPYVQIVRGPVVNLVGQIELVAKIWPTQAAFTAGDDPYRTERFLFSRSSATGSRIVTDPADDHPLLDDDTRAPVYTATEARQQALADNPTLGVLQALVSASGDSTAQNRWTAMVDVLKDQYMVPYEPTGRVWKRETIPSLDVAEIKDAIRRYYDRTSAAEGAGQDIMDNDAAIGNLAGQEFAL